LKGDKNEGKIHRELARNISFIRGKLSTKTRRTHTGRKKAKKKSATRLRRATKKQIAYKP